MANHFVNSSHILPVSQMMRLLNSKVEKQLNNQYYSKSYPIGLKGVVVGEGDTYEEALADVKSAVQFHIETFGKDAWAV